MSHFTLAVMSRAHAVVLSVAMVTICALAGCSSVQADPEVPKTEPSTYEECVAAQGKILRSYPGQCITASGARFVDPVQAKGNSPFADSVRPLCVNQCGNGSCQEMVCLGEGCPCAENPMSCPADCK